MYVFVYGTLKTGGPLHERMNGATSLGPAETRDSDFGMIDLGYYPGVVKRPGCLKIKGELFEGDNRLLEILDRVEGVPRLYTREQITVVCDGVEHTAWVYIYNADPRRNYNFITTGEWNNG